MKRELIREDDKAVSPVIAVILMVAITVVLAGVLYVWVTSLSTTEDTVETITGTLKQGGGNATEGVFFTLNKGSGKGVEIADYTFRVGEKGKTLIVLKWPADGNSTYSIDSGQKPEDDKWWDAAETVGFDAPTQLENIGDGSEIEVKIKNEETGQIVFSNTFTYRAH